MQLIDVDAVHAQSFEASFHRLAKVRRSGIVSPLVWAGTVPASLRSEEHTSELQSRENLVCRLLLEKKKNINVLFASQRARPMHELIFGLLIVACRLRTDP